ncbi:MAG: peptidoglycan D,D-transpeptidase FtsI family protein [Thermoanaerobaculaceae bacterium]
MKVDRVRFQVLAAGFLLASLLLMVRLAAVQLFQHRRWLSEGEKQQEAVVAVDPPRGDILTRDGLLLAGSLERVSVYANPKRLPRHQWEEAAEKLAPLVGLSPQAILGELAQRQGFFYLAKNVDPTVAVKVARLNLRGVGTLPSRQRLYPLGTLAAAVVGFVNADGKGQAGVETSCQNLLAGEGALVRLFRDGKRVPTPLQQYQEKPGRPGFNLVLTIDSRVQWILEEELRATLEKEGGKGASAVAMDPYTGEVLGLASLPSFDPQELGRYPKENWHNRAVEMVLEPGSTFKPFVVAAALAAGSVTPEALVDCSGGGIRLAGFFIRDHASYGLLPLRQVLAFSSNVGAIKVALQVPSQKLDETIRALGFGQPTGVELPAEAAGIYRRWERSSWSALTPAGLALGQEISVTAIQLARAYAALANGGILVKPTLIREVRDPQKGTIAGLRTFPSRRALPTEVAHQVAAMLESVVEEGTGRAAAVAGFRIAGKTGTAQKAVNGSYKAGRHAAWFAGFFPLPEAKMVLVVCVDEPGANFWAAEVAAPTFGRIAQRLTQVLGLEPNRGGFA